MQKGNSHMQGKVEICGVNTSKLPLLTAEEKEQLFCRIKDGDVKARETYIEGNLRLVLSVIKRFSSSNENVDDLTVQYEENGLVVIKELDKVILSRGAWATIIFRFQEWRQELKDYGPDKYSIRRYHKVNGEYRYQSKFNISSADQARKLIDALESWMPKKSAPSA